MYAKLTIPERLKDLRVMQKHLTLEELAEQTGLSKSALGKYETDDYKDISPFAIVTLANFYGVATDYLLGLTETKNHPNTTLDELHLSDAAIDILKGGKLNNRLICEILCHENFRRLLLDSEIYVDRIVDMRINDINALLKVARKNALEKADGEDVYTRSLEVGQIDETEYFAHILYDDLKAILKDVREAHKSDTTTADVDSTVANMQKNVEAALSFEGSQEEKSAKLWLSSLNIDYNKLSKEEFVTLINILEKSTILKNRASRRGKTLKKR